MSTLRQLNFSAGEISPNLYSRIDTSKYQSGLRTCRNMIVMRHGGLTNRPGSRFVGEVRDSSKGVRLIPFAFNNQQTYVLEFGPLTIRFIKNGAYITDTTKTITGISKASQAVVTSNSHGLSNGDEVAISGVLGMTQVNNRNFKVSDVTTNTFKLKLMDGTTYLNSSTFSTYTSGGSAARIYTIASPYIEEDLLALKYVQSADVMTIAHNNYAPRELARTGDASWTLSVITFAPTIATPGSFTATQTGTTGGKTYRYRVTAVSSDSFEESLVNSASVSNGNATLSGTDSITLAWAQVTNALQYNLYKEANNSGLYGFIGSAIGLSFSDSGLTADVTKTPPSSRDPFALGTTYAITGITKANPAVVTAVGHPFSDGELVYISGVVGMTEVNNLYFHVTKLSSSTFSLQSLADVNMDSSAYTAYSSAGTVQSAGNYPSTVAYYQQRLSFADSLLDPESVWTSQINLYKNFTYSNPQEDSDAVTFRTVGRQVNSVHHLVDLGTLALFTAVGEWTAEGNSAGILTPTQVNLKQRSYNGSLRNLAPVVIDGTALYVQARGSVVRDFNFQFQVDGYRGNDLTIFSSHLVEKYSLLDVTYQKVPHSNVWFVRDDGTLLGLTYVTEQAVLGWHRHDFENGIVENVCAIPNGNEDELYLVLKRTIGGATKRYVERFASRTLDDVVDAIFVDAALTYDGRNTGSQTMTLSGSGWTYTDTLTLTSSTSYFTAADVGNEIHLTDTDGSVIRFAITGYTSGTVVTGKPNRTVPVTLHAVATTSWAKAIDQVTGLWHLEGQDVSIFADGFVVANPNNDSYNTVTVANGTATLARPYSVIHVGLPITADVETLDIDTPDGETVSDKKMSVSSVSVRLVESRGLFAGSKPPPDEDADFLGGLYELKIRNQEDYDDPVDLQTGVVRVVLQSEWNSNGRVFLRQTDPLPLTITSIMPDGVYPFSQKGS